MQNGLLISGVDDCQYGEAFTGECVTLSLPSIGDWVVVIVTALISATELFVQLPLGCVHPLHLLKDSRDSCGIFICVCKSKS